MGLHTVRQRVGFYERTRINWRKYYWKWCWLFLSKNISGKNAESTIAFKWVTSSFLTLYIHMNRRMFLNNTGRQTTSKTWSGCADRKFILKWPTGSCLWSFVRLLCLVKSFAAISLSGHCDNPALVPQVFITCHVFTFPTNFNSPDFMCDYADELTTKEISPPRSQEKLQ